MSENSRRQFDIRLVELFDKKDQSSSHLTGDKYKWIINRLIALSVGDVKKVTKDYRLVKMYELIAIPYGTCFVSCTLGYRSPWSIFQIMAYLIYTAGYVARGFC